MTGTTSVGICVICGVETTLRQGNLCVFHFAERREEKQVSRLAHEMFEHDLKHEPKHDLKQNMPKLKRKNLEIKKVYDPHEIVSSKPFQSMIDWLISDSKNDAKTRYMFPLRIVTMPPIILTKIPSRDEILLFFEKQEWKDYF